MSFAEELVGKLRVAVNSLKVKRDKRAILIGLKDCAVAARRISIALKNAKSTSARSHLTTCMGMIKGFKQTLKAMEVVGFGYAGRNETAKHRVKWEDLNSAFDSRIRTGAIINLRHTDPKLFLEDCAAVFRRRIQNALKKMDALKVNATLCGEFQIKKAENVIEEEKFLSTPNAPIYRDTNLDEWFNLNIKNKVLTELEEFRERDSGWALSKIVNLVISFNKYNPLHAGSYVKLPEPIAKKRACVNVYNTDEMCFAYSVVSALYPVKTNANLTSSYPDPREVLNLKGIRFPMTVGQIPRFERQNNVSINVYRVVMTGKTRHNYTIVPHYITKSSNNDESRHINLLLIQDRYYTGSDADHEENMFATVKYHYVWIKNLSRLLSSQLSKRTTKKYFCERCLHYFHTEDKLDVHKKDCNKMDTKTPPKLPSEGQNILEFKNHKNKEKVPFIIYADSECLLLPVKSENTSKSSTQITHNHVPYSVGYYVKCQYDETLSYYRTYTGENCMEWFLNELKQLSEDLETVFLCPIPMDELTVEQKLHYRKAKKCHICEQPFSETDKKVRDHCHFTGKYRGPAHANCNLQFHDSRMVPVVFHNLSCYDGHLIIKALSGMGGGSLEVLPVNKERYISFTKHFGILKFRFLDSFRFMASGLDKLASYLEDYPVVKSQFRELPEEQFKLLTRKGTFPYDWMDGWNRLLETSLPPKHGFYNSLNDEYISSSDYAHAQKVWLEFKCSTMKDYSDLYLKTDVLLLADVFEQFRESCIQTYGLDPAHKYTLPGYAWDAMMYKTQQKLELLTDYNMVTFIERGIRGGLSQVSKRFAAANNKYMPDYDPLKETNYLMYFDINNQYGWAMSQHLPYGDFKWLDENEIMKICVPDLPDDAAEGYILEVDLDIPKELHDKFTDLPPCPEHSEPDGCKNGSVKLLATLHNKKEYVIHYRNLKQALQLGIKLVKIHRVLSFKQSPWLKSYIDLNTELRQNAKNEFEKNLFKLMNNAVFGKTMENVRNYSNIRIISTWEGRYGLEAAIARPEFKSVTIINENMVIVELNKTIINFNKPIYVGMCILDIAKTTIYDFHYNYMMQRFPHFELLYTDTDSLIYQIFNTDVYEVMREDCKERFDTSDYQEDNIYNIPRVNKKVLGKMKDENIGNVLIRYAALRSKMYCTKVLISPEEMEKQRKKLEEKGKEIADIEKILRNLGVTKKIKGIKKCVIKNKIEYEDYIECLETFMEITIDQTLIKCQKHNLLTVKQKKIGLSPHDDKRIISRTSYNTLPWGHYACAYTNMETE